MTDAELRDRTTHFFASIGATGFAAVINFAGRDQCVVFLRDFPPQLGADIFASVARQMAMPVPANLN